MFTKTFKSLNNDDIEIITQKFDHLHYINQLKSKNVLILDGSNEVDHYLKVGQKLNLSPVPYFDNNLYLDKYPDVKRSGIQPFLHYLKYGVNENRSANSLENKEDLKFDTSPVSDLKFDSDYYMSQLNLNKISLAKNQSPAQHYSETGFKIGLNPNKNFDVSWYLNQNDDVKKSSVEPFFHYVKYGRLEGRLPQKPTDNNVKSNSVVFENSLSRHPLISILITNRNGMCHLEKLFESIKEQTYQNFEVIFFDDNSTDNSVDFAKSNGAIVIKNSSSPVGFATANNRAYEQSKGELIALINNDMRLDPLFLEEMIFSIRKSASIAAVSPKMRFWSKFQRLTIKSSNEFKIVVSSTENSLSYKKTFVREGNLENGILNSILTNGRYQIVLDIPLQREPVIIEFSEEYSGLCEFLMPGSNVKYMVSNSNRIYSFTYEQTQWNTSFHIINNAGGLSQGLLNPCDRGFGEVEEGQYNSNADVEYFCGGAVLLRRASLGNNNLFIDQFVAYYEDSELSKRLTNKGYKIAYCPSAVVYHKHSSSNIEKSAFWRKYTYRNKFLFQYIFSSAEERKDVLENVASNSNHLIQYMKTQSNLDKSEKEFANNLNATKDEVFALSRIITSPAIYNRARKTIGIYNPYWDTRGGGEAHSLKIAEILSQYGNVELISTSDFDLNLTLSYFGMDSKKYQKRIVSNFTSKITAEYDVFVNSSYQDTTPSLAKVSFFLMYFPSKIAPINFLKSYYFLYCSEYTKNWAGKYLGQDNLNGSVLYPSVEKDRYYDIEKKKGKKILSVGRFTASGHIKNQFEIVSAYRMLSERNPDIVRGWELILAGSGNETAYIDKVKANASDLNISILIDVPFEELKSLYDTSYMYVHASGYGRDEGSEPELFEHFGMSVAEAASAGCVPIVYNAAGPSEIISKINLGYTYNTIAELSRILEKQILSYNEKESLSQATQISKSADIFSSQLQAVNFEKIIEKMFVQAKI